MSKQKIFVVLFTCVVTTGLSSCHSEQDAGAAKDYEIPPNAQQIPAQLSAPESPVGAKTTLRPRAEAIDLLADNLHLKAIADSQQLNAAIANFLQQPNQGNLKQARQAWHQAHTSLISLLSVYQADPLWRWLNQAEPNSVLSMLNAAPLLPGYLDSVPGYPASGIVAALEIPLNYASLASLHQHADPEFVVLGLHPLEYFLWTGIKPLLLSSSGKAQANQPVQQQLNERRRQLIKLISDAYRDQLVSMQTQWQQHEYGQFYKINTTEPATTYSHPLLAATINYLDRFVTQQLEVRQFSNNYAFADRFQFSRDASSLWHGVNLGITGLIGISTVPADQVNNQNAALVKCLLNLPLISKNPDANACQAEVRELKETVMMSHLRHNQ